MWGFLSPNVKNPKLEARSSKQIQSTKDQNASSQRFCHSFIRACFGFRISDFVFFRHRCLHSGSLFIAACVKRRRACTVRPYVTTAVVESFAPGGSSMKGMNLSGKPGIVQPMHTPPTFGQPPIPFIQPRLPTLQFTTGPQQPSLTMHSGTPY